MICIDKMLTPTNDSVECTNIQEQEGGRFQCTTFEGGGEQVSSAWTSRGGGKISVRELRGGGKFPVHGLRGGARFQCAEI